MRFRRDHKDRLEFERGVTHGIAIAMLSAGLSELRVEGNQHALWAYTHRLSSDLHDLHGTQTYRIAVVTPHPDSVPSKPVEA